MKANPSLEARFLRTPPVACRKTVLGTFGAALLLTAGADPARAGDWPRWRGPAFNGISAETGWFASWSAAGPKQLWKANVGTGFSSLAVSQGRLYTMGNRDDVETVWCLDADTGRVVWQHSYPCPVDPNLYEGGPNATPTVAGNRVFTLSRRGHLFAFDAATGKVVWSKNLAEETGADVPEWGFSGSPLVEGSLLILNVGTAGTAVDARTGKLAWCSGTDAAGYSSPFPIEFAGRRLVVFFTAAHVVAVEPKTGRRAWDYPWRTSYDINAADPVLAGDRLFISSGYNKGAALLQLQNGDPAELWRTQNMRNQFNPSVLVGGHLYGIDGNTAQRAALNCIDLETGALQWSEPGVGFGSLMAADGKLIVLSARGELIVAQASPRAFRPLARTQVLGGRCWTTPVLAHGKIYCRNAAGDLVCVAAK